MAERDIAPPKIRKLSVIVPVYNERNTVVEMVRRMRAVELPDGIEREIIVVDDGSTDGTRDVLRQLGDSTVRVLMHEATAARAPRCAPGSRSRPATTCSIQDADLEYDPEDWPRLIAPVLRGQGAASCTARASPVSAATCSCCHWIGNRLLSLVTNVLFNSTLSDMETCYKLVDRTVLNGLDAAVGSLRHRARDHREDPEAGIRIYEVPISYMGREFDEGKKITWRDGFAALWTLVKFRFGD